MFPADSSYSGSGTASVIGQTIHITLSGGTASHAFQVVVCGFFPDCQSYGSITTDAPGNAAADLPYIPGAQQAFLALQDNGIIAYQSAFRVQ